MTGKVDFKRTLDTYRAPRGGFAIVDVPAMQYLMIDGHGDPNESPAFGAAIEAVYPVAYKLKFASKRDLGRDYVVPPREALWWADDMSAFTSARDKARWDWTLLLMVPGWIGHDMFVAAVEQEKAKNPPARIDDLRLEDLAEGRCVQTLHVGSFDDEAAVLAQLHDDFIPAHGMRMAGKHHEIYISATSAASCPRSSARSSGSRSSPRQSRGRPLPRLSDIMSLIGEVMRAVRRPAAGPRRRAPTSPAATTGRPRPTGRRRRR